jgi:hypothetical protein
MLVTIKKHEREVSWGAKDPKTGKLKAQYDNTSTKWVPGLNKSTGQLRTGLASTKDETKFEKALGLEQGSLKITSDYWSNFFIIIPENGLEIDTEVPMHDLWYHALKADPTVATSQTEANMPGIEFVMVTENEEAKSKNKERDIVAKAFARFATMTQDEVTDALYMLGEMPGSTDSEVCRNLLGDLLEGNPAKFLRVVGDPHFEDKVWIIKLIKKGVVKKDGVGKGYNLPLRFNDILLGESIDAAVAYLKSKDNQNILIGLKKAEEAIDKL